MAHVSTIDRKFVIAWLRNNPGISHTEAAAQLKSLGHSLCHTTVIKIRRDERIPYTWIRGNLNVCKDGELVSRGGMKIEKIGNMRRVSFT